MRTETNVIPEPKDLDKLLGSTKYIDPDPEVGQAFWVGCPDLKIQRGLDLLSKRNGRNLQQSDIMYCCGACVWLEPPYHGTCRIPVCRKPPTEFGEKQSDQTVYWVLLRYFSRRDDHNFYNLF